MATRGLSIRVIPGNENHHLWNNNGTWWCHYTVHRPDFTKQRIRQSLRTSDAAKARARRDRLLREHGGIETKNEKQGLTEVPSRPAGRY